jgi:hypothetical protein
MNCVTAAETVLVSPTFETIRFNRLLPANGNLMAPRMRGSGVYRIRVVCGRSPATKISLGILMRSRSDDISYRMKGDLA